MNREIVKMATTRNHDDVAEFTDRQFYQEFDRLKLNYSNPKSFVNFLPPPRGFGEGWGGVKILRLLQGLLYLSSSTKLITQNN